MTVLLALWACTPEFRSPPSVLSPTQRAERLQAPLGPVKVVIDADLTNEIDDEFAVVWALSSPASIEVEAIYAAPHALWPGLIDTGTSRLDKRLLLQRLAELGLDLTTLPATDPADGMQAAYDEALAITALLGHPAPVFRGAPAYLPSATGVVESDAVSDLITRAREPRDGPLYVVCLGAPTNVASALNAAPDLVERIVVVWTAAYPSFWPYPNASFNLAQDVHASRVVFESGVPLVYVPGFYVGEELRVTLPEMAEHVQGRGVAGPFLYDLYANRLQLGTGEARSKVLWDLAAFAWLVDSSWLDTRLVPTPSLHEDLRWAHELGSPWMREAHDLDRDGLLSDFYEKLD